MQYGCRYVESVSKGFDWSSVEAVTLRDTVTGDQPRLDTQVRACWTKEELHICFECEDDHIVATMENRDDPIYDEDVVEVFIDELRTGRDYLEFEISPRNVLFDALIHMEDDGETIQVDTSWDAEGFHTVITKESEQRYVYDIVIPFSNVKQPPVKGTEWNWNLYRIDDDQQGTRPYWAWSPTGKENFHVPKRFGSVVFI